MGNLLGVQKEESSQERKERLQREYGVLIPPSFVVGGSSHKNMPLVTRAKLVSQPHNVLEYLWNSNGGNRILLEYMSPGFHFSVPTSPVGNEEEGGHLLISLDTATTSNNKISSQQQRQPLQQIWAGHGYGPIYAEGLMTNEQQPSLRVKYHPPTSKFNFAARLSPGSSSPSASSICNDGNWIDASYRTRTSAGMEWMFGGWMTTSGGGGGRGLLSHLFRKSKRRQQPAALTSSSSSSTLGILNLQTAVEYQESLIAAHVCMPVNSTANNNISAGTPEVVSTLLSLNLNNTGGTTENNNNNLQHPQKDQPPLWLTLRNDQHSSSRDASLSSGWKLNLSQSFTFDRPTWNILEDRAPNVRQTVGWAVQVEQMNNSAGDNNSNSHYYNPWSMGVTWQLNRGFAIKGVFVGGGSSNLNNNGSVEGNGGGGGRLTYGAILKRWEQPRVTLSLLNQFDIHSRKHCFLGFGLELETTPLSFGGSAAGTDDDDAEYYNQQQEGSSSFPSDSTSAPPTKITIPKKRKKQE